MLRTCLTFVLIAATPLQARALRFLGVDSSGFSYELESLHSSQRQWREFWSDESINVNVTLAVGVILAVTVIACALGAWTYKVCARTPPSHAPDGTFDADWEGGGHGGQIQGTMLKWRNGNESTIRITTPTEFSVVLNAQLADGKLRWTNGPWSEWTKVGDDDDAENIRNQLLEVARSLAERMERTERESDPISTGVADDNSHTAALITRPTATEV
mmetsp:Transcript_77057/g.121680  ORF Transcript_77057/g.121680 Transcript_77057/m.121680 type:complete len:216 (-) Transcript_77057:75-722(-)